MRIEFTYFQPYYGAENSFIYLLTAILFLLAVISFIKGKYDVLNSSFVYSICLGGFCALAALYTEAWNLPMHFNTAVLLIVMSILFFMGSCLADFCCSSVKVSSGCLSKGPCGFLSTGQYGFSLCCFCFTLHI